MYVYKYIYIYVYVYVHRKEWSATVGREKRRNKTDEDKCITPFSYHITVLWHHPYKDFISKLLPSLK